jgi:hypothetical protein
METLAELNKKYKAVLDSISLALALDGRLDELQYIWKSSESSDED